jgi:cytochrome c-type biogenesis protein CcmE
VPWDGSPGRVAWDSCPGELCFRVVAWSARFKGRAALAGSLLLGAAALGWFVYSDERVIYARSVDEVVRDAQKHAGKALRVDGVFNPASFKSESSPCVARFALLGRQERLDVRYRGCTVSESLFCSVPGWEQRVVVEGELGENPRSFEAERVLVRCPGKYEMKLMREGGTRDAGCPCLTRAAPPGSK